MRRNDCLKLFTLLVFIAFLLPAKAQEEFVPPPAKLLTHFPFKTFSGGVVILKACIDNHPDSLNFVLDTGSSGISLDSVTCEKLGLKTEPSDRTIRGIAGIRNVSFANNHKLKLPGLTTDSLNFHINDYEILTSVYGEHIDGIIGYSFLSRYIVKIDYDTNRIFVYSKGLMKYPRGGHLLRPLIVNLPMQAARIRENGEVQGRFYFDIGAGLCLLLSTDFAEDSVKFSSKKKSFNTQVEGLGGKAKMRVTTVREFRLGPYKFKKVPAYIFDDEYNVTSYPYLGGLIGNDLLRRFNVILNYERRDFYITPNRHFREPFDYAYSGLGFYFIDGQIQVTDVMEGSPAQTAGFKVGDVILAVNNVFSNNIQTYKTLFQNTGEKFKIIIIRDGAPMEITMKVKSIL